MAIGWAAAIGGFAIFFLGLGFTREGVQSLAGERVKLLVAKLQHNRLAGTFFDALAAMSLQSSKAAILIAINFAQSRLIRLKQLFAVILGVDIGTAILVLFLAFPTITKSSLYILAVGLIAERFFKTPRVRNAGSLLLGVGLVLFGMQMLYGASVGLASSEASSYVSSFISAHPTLLFFASLLLTVIMRAKIATVALAVVLAYAGILNLTSGIVLVLGANMGEALVTAIPCMKQGTTGRRATAFRVLVKAVGVAAAFPFIGAVSSAFGALDGVFALPGVQIALAHLAFNLALLVVFMPFAPLFAALAEKVIKKGAEVDPTFGPKYLNDTALDSPTVAFAAAKQEVMRLATIAEEMFEDVLKIFKLDSDFETLSDQTGACDDRIDVLEKSVRLYLARMSSKGADCEMAADEVALLTVASEIEDIGDAIHRDLLKVARRKRRKLARFSEAGWNELNDIHGKIKENFDLMRAMLTRPHEDIVKRMERRDLDLEELEQELRQAHLARLREGIPETHETSTIHLDILSCFRTINFKLTKIVRAAIELA